MNNENQWPAWFNGPNGETEIFNSPDEVPNGWTTGAEKRAALIAAGALPAPEPKSATPPPATGAAPIPAPAPGAAPATGAAPASPGAAAGADADKPEIDANGHPWSADLYAPTKTKTTAGLWRMKVGKSRPAPAPGYPLDL